MSHQAIEKRAVSFDDTSLLSDAAEDTLDRIWEEAERIVIARIPLNSVPQRSEPEKKPERARYSYD